VSTIRLTIGSDLKDAALIGQSVHAICRHLELADEVAYGVELCVVEGVTNAIKHAYRLGKGHEVSVTLSITSEQVEIEIVDYGLPMPEERVKALRQGSAVLDFDEHDRMNLPEGGMGLQIMHLTMDDVDYHSDGVVNRLHMVKHLAPNAEAI